MKNNPKEAEIIRKAQEDIRYFEELYEIYFPKIYSYTYRKTSNKELAEDLTQQTFLQAIQAFNSYHYQENRFSAWLYRIAHNLVVNEYKKRGAISIEHIESTAGTGEEEIIENVDSSIQKERLIKCLSELPPNYKEVVELKKEGLKNTEIGNILEKTESAIKVAFFRAVRMLRDCLESLAKA
jgi:RNA polymerase sigma-70 factor (ECF subfamily)